MWWTGLEAAITKNIIIYYALFQVANDDIDDEIRRACDEQKNERIPSYLSMGRDVFQSSFSSGDMSREQELMHASDLSDSQSSAIKVEVNFLSATINIILFFHSAKSNDSIIQAYIIMQCQM